MVAIALVVATAWTDPPRRKAAAAIDVGGLLTLVGGMGMLVVALMEGPEWGWSSATIPALLIGGSAALIAFVLMERRIRAPLIEVDLFRSASFSACNLVIFMAQFNKMAVIIFGALYLQDVLHMSPLMAGLRPTGGGRAGPDHSR